MIKSSITFILLIASAAQVQASFVIDAPPMPPKIEDKTDPGRPPHHTAVIILDPETLDTQNRYLRNEAPQEIPEEYWHWSLLAKIGEKLVAEGVLKSVKAMTPGAKMWMSDSTYRDFRVGYTTDPEGKPTLVVAFPIALLATDNKFKLNMVDDISHVLFSRIWSEFKGQFRSNYRPTVRGTVTFAESVQPFNFRFYTDFTGFNVELAVEQFSNEKAFLKALIDDAKSCKTLLK